MFVAGLVVAAGSSRRLGRPKQLLPFGGATLLDATLDLARACHFDQLIVTLGAAASEVRSAVDLGGTTVVEAEAHTAGCSSSIVSALPVVDPRARGVVHLLGDQPGIQPDSVAALLAAAADAPLAVCRYDDGPGHPFWFHRSVFDDLGRLHGDKAVWTLLESGRHPVREVAVPGTVPRDVDTWDDYELLLAEGAIRGA